MRPIERRPPPAPPAFQLFWLALVSALMVGAAVAGPA